MTSSEAEKAIILEYLQSELEESQAGGDAVTVALFEREIAELLNEKAPPQLCPVCNDSPITKRAGITICINCGNKVDSDSQPIDPPNYVPIGYEKTMGLISAQKPVGQYLMEVKLAEAEAEAEAEQ